MQKTAQESWEVLETGMEYYDIYLVAEEHVHFKDDQYVLNYAMVRKDTNRVEGYAPSFAAAIDTCMILDQTMKSWEAQRSTLQAANETAQVFTLNSEEEEEGEIVH